MVPFCSILISCYNKGMYVDEAVGAALVQSDAEVIIVDDGSKDSSIVTIIERLRGAPLRLICQPNRGAATARNRALCYAVGETVLYMDGDDLLPPNYVEEHRKVRAGRSFCVTYAPTRYLRGVELSVPDDNRFCRAYASKEDFFASILEQGWCPVIHGWVWPRSALLKCGPWRTDVLVNDDYEYSARALQLCDDAVCCLTTYAIYRQDATRLSVRSYSRTYFHSLVVSAEVREHVALSMEDSLRMRHAVAQWWYRILLDWGGAYDVVTSQIALRRCASLREPTCAFLTGRRRRVARLLGIRSLVWMLRWQRLIRA